MVQLSVLLGEQVVGRAELVGAHLDFAATRLEH
jgi:hypothetical protein